MFRLALIPLGLLLALIVGSVIALIAGLEWSDLTALLHDREIRFAVSMSISTALSSLILSILISLPAAWAIVRRQVIMRRFINVLLDVPMVTPPLVIGIGLLLLLGTKGPIGGNLPTFASALFSPLGVVIAQTYVASAIMVRSAISALSAIDKKYISTAYNLGLTPAKTFLLVEIPLCWRPLLGGCIIAFSRAIGEFGATLMLAGATRLKTETLPMAVYLNIASGEFNKAISCAVILICIAVLLLITLHFVQGSNKHG